MLCALALTLSTAWPQTRAEQSDYHLTSTYSDVIQFLHALEEKRAPIRVEFIGQSTEGREIPRVIVADPMVASAAEARRQGKLIVYVQANIHAGEVEGKEAALMLLRRLGQEHEHGQPKLLKNLVLVVNPIYNADGNEKFGPVAKNRPEQDGPDVVGLRPNGQGLDLNRDCIKAESPEMRAALDHVYTEWDPDAMLDLHTTDGTRHGYELTYSPPLNPNTEDHIYRYSRDELLPTVRKEILARKGLELFDYGNGGSANGVRVWETFGQEGRYVTNYAGLCNRVGILSEATTFIPFRARVEGTDIFVSSVLDHLARDKDRIRGWRKHVELPQELGVRFAMEKGRDENVIIEKLAPGEKAPLSGRPKQTERIPMQVFDRFKVTKTARVPQAYYVPADQSATIRLLLRHGIRAQALTAAKTGEFQQFTVTSFKQDARAFQGHKLIHLDGTFNALTTTVPIGTYEVRTDQPLGGLAFHILEPESLDGAAAWGFLGESLTGTYPILKSKE